MPVRSLLLRSVRSVRSVLSVLFVLLLAATAHAHVGSPNVFFDGNAGPYPLRVIIRPPEVIPGVAEVTVRLREARDAREARRVTVQPIQWQAGPQGAPPPDAAQPVPGAPATWSAQLWLMTASSYSVRVHVEGAAGAGHVLVPVTAVPSRVLEMPRGMGAVLAGLGLLLFAGAVSIVGAAVRESVLAPGEAPDAGGRRRTRGGAAAPSSSPRPPRSSWPGPSGAARAGGTAWRTTSRRVCTSPSACAPRRRPKAAGPCCGSPSTTSASRIHRRSRRTTAS